MRKVYMPTYDGMVGRMFKQENYHIVDTLEECDLVCFVGGADVNPDLYGHPQHRTTYIDGGRDIKEVRVYMDAVRMGLPMVGICRGGQFLNVMNDGVMYQDVTNHALRGVHLAEIDGQILNVSSTHHQMMFPGVDGEVIGVGIGTDSFKTIWNEEEGKFVTRRPDEDDDIEVVVYGNQLCFQPHPELALFDKNVQDCMDCFFKLVDKYCQKLEVAI